ncbi:ankyrin repeat-containing domain protein [Lophiotrema nucula]|uniref:Ankyrin repeat-containing domain protein n=1 Tax=Lophiotrema nucula TaxID=690887 RepID=A0A6A5YDS1_9PLEO|nr:ankyrin repeat-containing domain protein [Lophiotrema nucula]
MDPLSVTASAITVATVAANTCLAFAQLRSFIKNLPGRVHALNNEVSDFQIVCFQLVNVLEEKQSHDATAAPDDLLENIQLLLEKAETKLEELQTVIRSLARHKHIVTAAAAFKREQEHLHSLQDDINTVKVSLNIVLGTINTRDMTRIGLNVEAIYAVTTGSELNILGIREDLRSGLETNKIDLETTLNSGFAQIEQRMENMLRDEAARLEDHQRTQLAMYKNRRLVQQRKAKAAGLASPHAKPSSEGVGIRLKQFVNGCKKGCVCACHKRSASETPSIVDRCTKAQAPYIKVEYWFPLGFLWSQIVRFEAAGGMGPQMQLSLLRRIPDSAASVSFALEGNVDGLRDLFRRGLASPRDVSDTRGYSLLRWAIYGQQWKTAKYLITEGADPDYRPIKQSDNSPRNKINDYYLQGLSSGDAVDYLRPIIDIEDWVDEQNFQPIHIAATGLSATSLEEIIKQDPDCINAVDALGRTALTWAAARGDHRTVMVLLAHDADPNLIDSYLGGPLSYAADRGHVKCVKLLLQAGAETDPILPGGQISGSPMNCASRNSKDPLVIKTLLDFGSDTESAGIDSKTPLIHVARTDNLDFALLFLERGANINASSATGETPLTTAIIHNSYKVL